MPPQRARGRRCIGSAVLLGALPITILIAACGASPNQSLVSGPAPTASVAGKATPAAAVGPTIDQLQTAAMAVFPACRAPSCSTHGAKFTTCDSGGLSGTPAVTGDLLAACPLTQRLQLMLEADTSGGVPGDPLGGGQAEAFSAEFFNAEPSASGGVVHVVLTLVDGTTGKTDLVFVESGGKLLLDDVYCTGSDQPSADAYAPGWLAHASCSA